MIAHENTRKRLMEPHDLLGTHFPPAPAAELPTQTFRGVTLNANGEQIDLRMFRRPTPTPTSWSISQGRRLHMGDLFLNGIYPFIDAGTGGNIDGMIARPARH